MTQTYTRAQLNAAVHSAIESVMTGQELHGNAVDNTIRQRLAAAISGGYDFADTLHNIYLDYGYPVNLDFFNFWNMYRRFGVARRIVELYPDQTWLDNPEIEGSQAFNRELETLVTRAGLWRRLKGLDTRQRIGRYAGLFMRVRDGKSPEQPITGKLAGSGALMGMVPLYESQLEVETVQTDPLADDFGMPTMYRFNGGAEGSRTEHNTSSFSIHPDRVIIASEDSDNGGIYGIPALESVYNSLMDLRKILGGGGEGFYKNAAQSLVADVKDGASAKQNAALLSKFTEQYDDFAKNRTRRMFWTPGMDTKILSSTLASPEHFANVVLMDIAAGSDIPVALLTGNQTGRLAGDQDTKGFLSRVQARRVDFGTDMVKATLDWMIRWGVLPASEYETEWPDAMAPSAGEKLENASTMATVNKTMFESGGVVPFTGDEIREAAGYEVVGLPDVELPDETLPQDDDAVEE